MSEYQQKDNSGALFRNKKEQVHNNGVQQVQAAVGGMSIAEMDEDIPF